MLVGPAAIAALVIIGVVFFAWGWARAIRYRSEHGKTPWGIPPAGWGGIHLVLLPVGWAIYSAASRTTKVTDLSLAHRHDSIFADTPEEREKLLKIVGQLPLLRPPQPDTRGWHPDPLGQKDFRYFDGQRWTREVTDDPARKVSEVVGDEKADRERRLRTLQRPADPSPSWHLDPLGEHHFRYFDGERWTEDVREARSS